MKRQLLILIDFNDNFHISIEDLQHYKSMNVAKLKNNFESNGFNVEILNFQEINYFDNYRGKYIIYQTSEANGGFYKKFIEDIILFLNNKGAIVLPKFDYLKAHHDKVYMELLRSMFKDEDLKTIKSKCFGNEIEASEYNAVFPCIIKKASGSASKGVYIARNKKEYIKNIKKASKAIYSDTILNHIIFKITNMIKNILKKRYPSINHNKIINSPFIIQNFIPNLTGDYKVLKYGKKYYCLYRENRKNDFRASGSGLIHDVPEHEIYDLLNYANKLTLEIDFPILGMDIGFDGKNYHLIEFQMIHLGPLTLQRSNYWYENINSKWTKRNGKSNLENEFTKAIIEYIDHIS